jgi:predicted nucleic acid-binding protein
MDYIDACVILASFLREAEALRCQTYLDRAGYRWHPVVAISHFAVSEIFVNLLTKIEDPEAISQRIFRLLLRLQVQHRIIVPKLELDPVILQDITEKDFTLTQDDILNIVAAIQAECSRFITIDKKLLAAASLKTYLQARYGLRIASP